MKKIGIIGGMGPLATADLFRKIILLTDAGSDREHIHIYIDSNTSIPDRTEAILHHGESPVPQLVISAVKLEAMGADFLVMPCNTAHYFYEDILPFVSVPVLHMIEETCSEIRRMGLDRVGLLATDGTCQSGVYDSVFSRFGIEILKPSQREQEQVMQIIYAGVKAGNRDFDTAAFRKVLESLTARGAQTLILGCTELPLAFELYGIDIPAVDPTTALAKAAIREALA